MDHLEGPRPTPRGYHTANLVNKSMVVIGGSDGSNCYNDVWILDLGILFLAQSRGERTDIVFADHRDDSHRDIDLETFCL